MDKTDVDVTDTTQQTWLMVFAGRPLPVFHIYFRKNLK